MIAKIYYIALPLVFIAFLYPSQLPLNSCIDISRVFLNFLDKNSMPNDSSSYHQRDAKNQPLHRAGCLSILEMSLGNDAEKYVCYL